MEVRLSRAATLERAAGPRGPVVKRRACGRCCGGNSNQASFGGSAALPARGGSLAPGWPGKAQLRGRSPRKQRKSRKSRVTTGLPLGSTHSSTGISPIDLRGARMRFLPKGDRERLGGEKTNALKQPCVHLHVDSAASTTSITAQGRCPTFLVSVVSIRKTCNAV